MNRLQDFIQKTRQELEAKLCKRFCEDSDLSVAITSGDIELPEWVSFSEDSDHIKLWDNEEKTNGEYNSQYWGFISIDYDIPTLNEPDDGYDLDRYN